MIGRNCFLAAFSFTFAFCVFSIATAHADLVGYWPLDTAPGGFTPNLAVGGADRARTIAGLHGRDAQRFVMGVRAPQGGGPVDVQAEPLVGEGVGRSGFCQRAPHRQVVGQPDRTIELGTGERVSAGGHAPTLSRAGVVARRSRPGVGSADGSGAAGDRYPSR